MKIEHRALRDIEVSKVNPRGINSRTRLERALLPAQLKFAVFHDPSLAAGSLSRHSRTSSTYRASASAVRLQGTGLSYGA